MPLLMWLATVVLVDRMRTQPLHLLMNAFRYPYWQDVNGDLPDLWRHLLPKRNLLTMLLRNSPSRNDINSRLCILPVFICGTFAGTSEIVHNIYAKKINNVSKSCIVVEINTNISNIAPKLNRKRTINLFSLYSYREHGDLVNITTANTTNQ